MFNIYIYNQRKILKVLILFNNPSFIWETLPLKDSQALNSPKSSGRPPSCSWERTDQWLQSLWNNSEIKVRIITQICGRIYFLSYRQNIK